MTKRDLALAISIALAIVPVGTFPVLATAGTNPRAETVLAQFPFSESERKRILAGDLVTTASREKTSDRELAITMAFLIKDPPADLATMFQQASGYENDKSATARGELRGDGTVADLAGLRLTPGDAEARRFANAQPGDDLNLSSAEIAALRALPEKSTAAVEAELRKLLLARYRAYRAAGLKGIAPYDRGKGKQTNPADDLARATKASPVLAREAPEVVKALLEYPRSQPPSSKES